MSAMVESANKKTQKGVLHCPICSRYVEGEVTQRPKRTIVTPGQRCPRCSSSLDAAYVVKLSLAA